MTNTSSISLANPILPNDVIENVIFPNLSLPALGVCFRVCRVWNKMAKDYINTFSHEKAFGPKELYSYFLVEHCSIYPFSAGRNSARKDEQGPFTRKNFVQDLPISHNKLT